LPRSHQDKCYVNQNPYLRLEEPLEIQFVELEHVEKH
jgi:hypothetical protein